MLDELTAEDVNTGLADNYAEEAYEKLVYIDQVIKDRDCLAGAMTEEEINNTLYMINMDSLVCGDYCYLYGGVQDDDNQTVTQTDYVKYVSSGDRSAGRFEIFLWIELILLIAFGILRNIFQF